VIGDGSHEPAVVDLGHDLQVARRMRVLDGVGQGFTERAHQRLGVVSAHAVERRKPGQGIANGRGKLRVGRHTQLERVPLLALGGRFCGCRHHFGRLPDSTAIRAG